MCGISGLFGEFLPGLMSRMNYLQDHRGPDGSGVFEDPDACASLGHVRLAILDLSAAAAQPMHSEDGRYVLVYNGEIYNFRELRRQLETDLGCRFRSTGDTEVLLQGLALYGAAFVRKLNGIFAFAFWDRQERELLLARDPVGVKPLYYCEPRPGVLLFASEIKALFEYPGLLREPNFFALQEHLARCHASGTQTAFEGIHRLGPGMMLRWESKENSWKIETYWQPDFSVLPDTSYEDACWRLRETVCRAIKRQMVSDVPVGSFLSGGLDSSLITLLSAEQSDQDFQCYTITYPSSENRLDQFIDDTPYAFQVAQQLQKTQVMINIKPIVSDILGKLIWHMDEPIADPAIIASYLISKYARRNGTVVLLSGQGADELFGGYPRYQAMNLLDRFQALPNVMRRQVVKAASLIPAAMEGPYGAKMRRARLVLMEMNDQPDQRFMGYCSSTADEYIRRVLHPEVRQILDGRPSAEQSLRMMAEAQVNNGNRYLYRDLIDYLPNHNLLYMDKMSMAAGVETRVPLLDMEIVEQVTRMPFAWKVSGMTTKKILRDAAKGIVPDNIIHRAKTGFGAPYRKWLRYDLSEMWNELTSEESIERRGWFNYQGVQEIRRLSQAGNLDLYMLQWAILTTELWARSFFDQDPTKRPA
jgi:asparagine synthase (glutamine-hydrolysing)